MTWVAGVAGILHSCPAKEDQSQTPSFLPVFSALSTGTRCICEVPEKVFLYHIEDLHSLSSNSSLAPAVPRIKSCAMQDRFCDEAVASK